MGKPTICLDFDGVLHSYASGWIGGADVIPDPPVPGAVEALCRYVAEFDVCILSSRSSQRGGIEAMRAWLFKALAEHVGGAQAGHILASIRFVTEKPPALVSIDDRAITFTGEFPSPDEIRAFRPWYKKAKPESV